MLIIGVDLAGSELRPTGFCKLSVKGNISEVTTKVLYSNSEIIGELLATKPKPNVVSIDAPLSIPKGRRSISDRHGPHFRSCDLELMAMHIKFFPITLGPMRMLTSRGMLLKKKLERLGFKVIESFPGGAQDLLGIPRKQKGLEKLRRGLLRIGAKGIGIRATGDELDAVTCALVGKYYLEGNYTGLGNKEEGLLIMPRPKGVVQAVSKR
ncbi:MAG: DUF429 domain-containing protein [Candidatus Micrarchaeaceae archaeon]